MTVQVLKVYVQETKKIAGYPFIIIAPDFVEHRSFPIVATLRKDDREQEVWVFRGEFGDRVETQDATIWLESAEKNLVFASSRVFEFFGEQSSEMELVLPTFVTLRQGAARMDRLPPSLSIEVSPEIRQGFKGRNRRTVWAVAAHCSRVVPVRLISSPQKSPMNFRCSAILKNFLGANSGDHIQLSEPHHVQNDKKTTILRELPFRNFFTHHMRLASFFAWVIWAKRGALDLFEIALRGYFKAPGLALMTHPAYLGDDNQHVIRLHPGAFPMIGIEPGDEVVVSWCGRRTSAIAYEMIYQQSVFEGVDLFSSHLQMATSSQVRFDLGIVKHTAVEVRRKVIPKIFDNLNSTFVPVVSVVAGGTSIHLAGVTIGLLAVIAAVLSLGKVRLPTAPPGQLPRW